MPKKSLFGFLTAFNLRGFLFGSIIQILLGYILLPIACMLLSLLDFDASENAVTACVGLISDMPIFGSLSDAITLLINNGANSSARLSFLATLVNRPGGDMFIAATAGMWTGICFNLCKIISESGIIRLDGVPVIQSILAVVITCMITKLLTVYGDPMYIMLSLLFTLVLNVVLKIISAKSVSLFILVELGCETVVGVFSCAFVAFLILLMQYTIPFSIALIVGACLAGPALIFMLIPCILP